MRIRLLFAIMFLAAVAACTPTGDNGRGGDPDPPVKTPDPPAETPDPIEKPEPGTKLPVGDVIDPAAKFPVLDTQSAADVYKQKKSTKRGISTNFRVAQAIDLLGFGVSWCYDWAATYSPGRWELMRRNSMTYAPMGWNGVPKRSDLDYNRAAGSEYLLGFNEPNLTDQADLTPVAAAELWPAMVEAAAGSRLGLVSPAMSWGTMTGYTDPEVWLDDFLEQPGVSLDALAAIAGHAYMPNTAGVKAFIRKFAKYGKPFWLTEFCHANGSISNDRAAQIAFMSDIITYLEADPAIERYAWFMDTGFGTSGGNSALVDWLGKPAPVLNPLGVLYNSASSLDKETHYSPGENIPAEHYSDSSATAIAAGDGWTPTVLPTPTTDTAGTLDISFGSSCWVEYLLDVPTDGTYRLELRYTAPRELTMALTTQWIEDQTVTFAATGSAATGNAATGSAPTWATAGKPIAMLSGRQTIRLSYVRGVAQINWIRLTPHSD